jgi:hypothetical protein
MKRLCCLEPVGALLFTVFSSLVFYFMGSYIFHVLMSGRVRSQFAAVVSFVSRSSPSNGCVLHNMGMGSDGAVTKTTVLAKTSRNLLKREQNLYWKAA